MNRLSERIALVAVLAVVLVGAFVFTRSGTEPPGPRARASASASSAAQDVTAQARSTIAASELPLEARTTITAIQAGGGFADDRDGTVFENREGLLPPAPRGFYHEYTVPTPGASDRGARRIVQSSGGVLYWSPDHYKTFRQIVLGQ